MEYNGNFAGDVPAWKIWFPWEQPSAAEITACYISWQLPLIARAQTITRANFLQDILFPVKLDPAVNTHTTIPDLNLLIIKLS